MSVLLQLAERCENATANEHVQLLWEAWDAIHGKAKPVAIDRWPGWRMPFRWDDFKAMVSAKAYESAAMTLVPEGAIWEVGHKVNYPAAPREPNRANYAFVNVGLPGAVKSFGGKSIAAPALALCAAVLRARAAIAMETGTAIDSEAGVVAKP